MDNRLLMGDVEMSVVEELMRKDFESRSESDFEKVASFMKAITTFRGRGTSVSDLGSGFLKKVFFSLRLSSYPENSLLFDDKFKPADSVYVLLTGSATLEIRSSGYEKPKRMQIGSLLISEVPLIRSRGKAEYKSRSEMDRMRVLGDKSYFPWSLERQ